MTSTFRKPDLELGRVFKYAVWYGPDGANGDCATEVEHDFGEGYFVAEYQHVGGYIEDYDPNKPFLKTSTYVEASDVREAAVLGTAKLAEEGGSEEFVAELPH